MYVEQVIIGALVILTVWVLAAGVLPVIPKELNEIAGGVMFIGGAYVAGILYDRCADSLLERIERRRRLRFAMKRFDLEWPLKRDPFPQFGHKQRIESSVFGYINSRMRILRALTTLLPAMTVAALILNDPGNRFFAAPATGVIYVLYGVLACLVEYPTTHHWKELNTHRAPPFVLEPIVLGFIAMTVLAFEVARLDCEHCVRALEIAIAGTTLTLISAWAWQRVNVTLMQLIITLHSKTPDTLKESA
ncbi:MAG: hypothetical protein DMF56_02865 [Acidobacteria bacterium]|nr:MAG: hypothetical protein DMF56_02865 [Acidobacteriota bacterium]